MLADGYEELLTLDAWKEKYHSIIQAQARADPDYRSPTQPPGGDILTLR